MKRNLLLLFCLIISVALFAQEKMYIHKSDKITLGALISATDSMYFSADGSTAYFSIENTLAQYPVSEIDSISFGENSNTIFVNYEGTSVSVINPLAFDGVTVAVSGADVTVISTSETNEVNYSLSGTTSDGLFKVYSNYSFNLLLNGVNITNANGPAINIQTTKKCSLILNAGTINSLTDGSAYATSTEDQKSTLFSEGQLEFAGTGSLTVKSNLKHAICSDDYIDIQGGTITVSGALKDGIHANDYFTMSGGTLNVTATSDGIDCETGYIGISGGSVTTVNTAADVKGISSDSTMVISGGTITVTVSGNQSKGLKSKQNMTLSGGSITINTSGSVVLVASGSGYDPSYCSAIKCDSSFTVNGANVIIKSTGIAGKGISADKNVIMQSGTINITTTGAGAKYTNSIGIVDSYNATCITADGNISLLGGSVTASSTGIGGKGISSDGTFTIGDADNSLTVNITTTGAKFLVSGSDYAEAKAVKSDGAVTINNGAVAISSADDGIKSETSITINNATVSIIKSIEGMEAPFITVNSGNISIVASDDSFNATKGNGGETNDGSCLYLFGGNIVLNSSAGDPLDSNGNIVMTGGTVIVHGPQSSPEVGMDYNGACNVSGGLLVISGTNSNMTQAPSTTSVQYSVKATTSSSVAAGTLYHIQDASGNDLVTFKPMRSYYSIVFSSSSLKSGSTYTIYTGGTSTGTNTNGLYAGGTYSGGTFKKSFTVSGKVTNTTF
ncbi:MAG: carbohydrate-binding domain-containing protein [Bacteroidales bacterium]|nr:carbohydrate-binding domain-containing protein [Bacteroidales bacterium]